MEKQGSADGAGGIVAPVLLLGVTGTVGARLAQALVADGHAVRGLVREGRAEPAVAPGLELRTGHLGDPDSLAEAAAGCDVVYHCAGEADLGADPEALSWLHVAGTENVVRAAEYAGVRRVVMLSCADATLQDRDRVHIREDQAMGGCPLGAWSRSKLLAEEVALRSATKVEVTAIRPGCLWGAGDFTNLPRWCREGLRGGIRLLSSGSQLYSVANLDNVVHALRLAARVPAAAGQAFYISDGEYETSREFFLTLSQALGLPPPRRAYGPWARAWARVSGGQGAYLEAVRRGRACLLDLQRALNDLGYAPAVTRVEALSELASFVAGQGGVEALAKHTRRRVDRTDTDAFKRFSALA